MRLARPLVLALSVVLLAALSLGGAGCGDMDGSKPFAGTSRYQEKTGAYELRLLEPPWVPLTIQGQLIFVVFPSDVINTMLKETDALYTLHINSVGGDPDGALVAARTSSWGSSSPEPVLAVSGAAGVEVSWQEAPTIYHREVFLGTAAGPTFYLHFTAQTPLADDGMVTQMILSFAPRGTSVTGAGK
jgi:hypothetical protein